MIDLTGQKFGRLTVLGFSHKVVYSQTNVRYYWKCRCDCGTEKLVLASQLRGGTLSCGCFAKEKSHAPRKHGMSNHRLFSIWHSMLQRCENPNSSGYHNYGGKGVRVCEEWHDSKKFFEWALNNGYREDLTIDRIDGNGNYEPSNCRWTDWKTQSNNTSRNHYLTINGETKTVAQWGEYYGVPYKTIYQRVAIGWSFERAVSTPVKKRGLNGRKSTNSNARELLRT